MIGQSSSIGRCFLYAGVGLALAFFGRISFIMVPFGIYYSIQCIRNEGNKLGWVTLGIGILSVAIMALRFLPAG